MKKLIAIMMAALMCAALLAGCTTPANEGGSSSSEGTVSGESSGETVGEAGELNLAIFEGGFGPEFWNQITAMFEEETGIKVNLEISPSIGDTIRPQIVAGNVPDFMNLKDNDQTGIVSALIKDKALLDLTPVFDGPQYDSEEALRDKILPGFLKSNKCAPYQGDDTIYLAPGAAGPMGPIYDKNLFSEKGWEVPVTWEDYFALGELAKADGIALQTYQGQYPSYMESMLLPALASALGDDFSKIENYEPGIWTDKRVIEVLEQFEKIYTTGNLMAGTVALTHTDAQAAQMMDKVLFIPCGTWMEGEMADADRADGYTFGITPTPVLKEGATRYVASDMEQFSIPANAPNAENAKLFLRYLYTDKSIAMYAEYCDGAVMATNNALDLVEDYISEGVYEMFDVYQEPNVAPLMVGFAATPEGSKIVVQDEIYNPIGEVMSGNMTAQEWAESVNQAYQDMADGK